jgi:DNA uptake protein ComE-like DNA-binding protein
VFVASPMARISLTMKLGALGFSVVILLLSGCFSNNPDTLREHTADATAAAKRDANAIAKGIVEGLARKGPANINSASSRDLQKLPGITPEQAEAIIAGRPYNDSSQLVRKHILSQAEYSRIRNQIVVK